MRDVVESITAQLATDGLHAYYLTAPDPPSWPYALLWGVRTRPIRDTFAGGVDLSDTLSVTWVSKSALGCLDLIRRGRDLLDGFTPTSATWTMLPLTLRTDEGQPVEPDRDVILPDTGTPPYFAVDRYRVLGYR